MNLTCFLKGHNWSYGRVASKEARLMLNWKIFHNRCCLRCGKEDWAADRAEEEVERRRKIKHALRGTQTMLDGKKIPPSKEITEDGRE